MSTEIRRLTAPRATIYTPLIQYHTNKCHARASRGQGHPGLDRRHDLAKIDLQAKANETITNEEKQALA